jgi:hypothetical protein
MTSHTRIGAALAAFAVAAAAQNDTVPALLQGVEGGTGTAIPFGLSGAARVQYVYDSEDLPWAGPRMVTRVSLRADNTDPGVTAFAQKGFLFVSLLLSTTAVRAENASATFADNYGTDATLVIDNVPITLPAQPALGGPRPAHIDFVLPVPWFYGLTPQRPGNQPAPASLLVEIRVHSQPPGTYRIDNVGSCTLAPVAVGLQGPACQSQTANAQPLQLIAGNSLVAGSSYSWDVRHADPNTAIVLFLGLDPQLLLGGHPGMPLPLPLFDPANPALPPPVLSTLVDFIHYSAPDCWLNVTPSGGFLIGAADAAGAATFTIAMSPNRQLLGMPVYAQAIAQSLTANPLQLVTSLGARQTVCGPLGAARIYVLGSSSAAAGQFAFGQGAVIELH